MPIGSENRTRAYPPDFEAALLCTSAGMAHLAEPASPYTCGACVNWIPAKQGGKGRCALFMRLMRGKWGPQIRAAQQACKGFERREG
jgi:hypothetical protein